MADSKLTDLTALTAVAAGDLFYVVDISDTTDDAAGSSKKITQANLLNGYILGNDGSVLSIDPSTLSPVVNLDPDSISGSDGDAISTVASGGTAANFTQSTSGDKPILKKTTNGLDNHNIIRFVSTDYLEAATGGASLATDWTVIEVRKRTGSSGFHNCVAWGDASNGERRSPHFEYNTDLMYFIGQSADVLSSATLEVDTWCILTTTYNDTTNAIKMYVNNVLVADSTQSLNAYASTAIRMGVNLAGSEEWIGDHARLLMFPSVLTDDQRAGVHTYLYETYPSVAATTARPIAFFSAFSTIDASEINQTGDGDIVVGGNVAIATTNTSLSVSNNALFSVNGGFAANVVSEEHEFANTWAGQNTLSIWNKSTTGFSAVRFRRTGTTGEEMAAIGYGRDQEPWGMAGDGSTYWEASNFNDTSKNGVMRLIQTKASGGVYSLRMDMQEDGTIVWNKRKNSSGDTLTPQLTLDSGGDIVAHDTLVVRQPGGTPGTDELQISHSGTAGLIECKDGGLTIKGPTSTDITLGASGNNIIFAGAVNGEGTGYNYNISSLGFKVGQGKGFLFTTSDSYNAAETAIVQTSPAVLAITNVTTGQWGALKLGTYDSGTNTITNGLTVGHRSSGTPAAGLGSAILFNIDSSTTADQAAGRLSFSWATATHASRLSKAEISVYNVGSSTTGLAIEAIGDSTVKNTLTGQLVQTGPARTALTASTENIGINFNQSATKQFAAGALTTQREVVVQAPTYSFDSGSNTITTAATVAITGAPIAGTNCAAITNPYALLVQRGQSKFTSDQGTPLFVQVTSSASATVAQFDYNGGGGPSILYNGYYCPGSRPYMVDTGYFSYNTRHINLAEDNAIRWTNFVDTYTAYDTGLKRSAAGILEINNATAGQWAQLKLGTYDAGTTTITDGLTVGHRSSGTPATGLGSAILFNIDSSTTADQAAGRLSFSWATATHASRLSKAAISVYDVSTERDAIVCEAQSGNILTTMNGVVKVTRIGTSEYFTMTKMATNEGTIFLNGDNGGFAFQNVYSGTNCTINVMGVYAGAISSGVIGSAYFFDRICSAADYVHGWRSGTTTNLGGNTVPDTALACNAQAVVEVNNGTKGQWGALKVGTYDSGTTTITDGLTVGHRSSGTPAAGLGSAILFNIDSSTTADQNAARLQSSWTVATHASRTSEVGIKTVTNAGSLAEVARFDGGGGASPSAGNTGFMLFDVDNGTLERVTVGSADSGGTGYKVLRIPN